jgi:hypothetical protein
LVVLCVDGLCRKARTSLGLAIPGTSYWRILYLTIRKRALDGCGQAKHHISY